MNQELGRARRMLRLGHAAALLALALGCSAAPEDTQEAPPLDETRSETQALHGSSLFCGGPDDLACGETTTCLPLAAGCPSEDIIGLCVPRPEYCFAVDNPVCGCDGESYPNICEALKNGTSPLHRGECEAVEQPECGGPEQIACPGSGLCTDEAGNICGRTGDDTCAGTCGCKTIEKCDPRDVWNDDPMVCACVPSPPDACSGVECPDPTQCVVHADGTTSCERLGDK